MIVTPERAASIYRYRFTCAHELGHLLLHPNPLPGDRQQEREADEFAAELLTPEPRLSRCCRGRFVWPRSRTSVFPGRIGRVPDPPYGRATRRVRRFGAPSAPATAWHGRVPSRRADRHIPRRGSFAAPRGAGLAEQHGLSRGELASELCWSTKHLSDVLSEVDSRPELHIVR